MDNASLWIAMAGLAATNIASGIGFYFTYKSQRSPLRQQLHAKQIEVLIDFSIGATRLQKIAAALQEGSKLSKEDQHSLDEHWDEVSQRLLDIVQMGGVVLPSDLYSTMTAFRACAEAYEVAIVKGVNVGKAYYDLMGAAAHVTMLSRELVGADSLSIESLKLHNRGGYDRMQQVGRLALARVSRALWTQSRRADRRDES
ncbi:hypothetical protein I6J77_13490 [Rhodanobacter sp. FDAARGOS 1247]|uniref:hypothetical protein n=1 Tax=Rhodanobacter sp. FDAARGOS 1247 TaxID=2778082 RepID=UPI0019509D40|nr:hypothetical protein [Rhodanobacter sp. FDAARGOS 1247]QRP63122.1 hypothetical protein I6J77_13490 [Rhodanobacter sp. FDAARGOS 1247]